MRQEGCFHTQGESDILEAQSRNAYKEGVHNRVTRESVVTE